MSTYASILAGSNYLYFKDSHSLCPVHTIGDSLYFFACVWALIFSDPYDVFLNCYFFLNLEMSDIYQEVYTCRRIKILYEKPS